MYLDRGTVPPEILRCFSVDMNSFHNNALIVKRSESCSALPRKKILRATSHRFSQKEEAHRQQKPFNIPLKNTQVSTQTGLSPDVLSTQQRQHEPVQVGANDLGARSGQTVQRQAGTTPPHLEHLLKLVGDDDHDDIPRQVWRCQYRALDQPHLVNAT